MRRISCVALAVLAAIVPACVLAQTESSGERAPHHLAWSFDPVHGSMQVVPQPAIVIPGKLEALTASEPKTYTGMIDVVYTVKLVSAQIKGEAVRCSGSVALEYEESGTSTTTTIFLNIGALSNAQNVDAVVSGSTATCRFTIPYSWTVPASTTTTTVTVEGISGSVGIATNELDSSGAVIRTYRSAMQQLEGLAVPAEGATVTLTASGAL
jgi:hypothetical protein